MPESEICLQLLAEVCILKCSMHETLQLANKTRVSREQAAKLLPIVYDELKRLAVNLLNREPPGHTLQPTALVHEAYLRVIGEADLPRWDNRGHFFAAAAQAMRRILVDAARRKQVYRRITAGHIPGSESRPDTPPTLDLIALDEALDQLAAEDPIAAQVVELRYFVGLSIDHATEALGVSRYEVTQKWTYARSWLRLRLEGPSPES